MGINVDELMEGMVLEKNIIRRDGALIVNKGTTLTPRIIERLRKLSGHINFEGNETTDMDEVKETVKSFEKILTDLGAKIDNSKDLGQKKLAYEIKKQVRGYYHLLNVECNSDAVKEFDRKALIDEKILRHLIIREEV